MAKPQVITTVVKVVDLATQKYKKIETETRNFGKRIEEFTTVTDRQGKALKTVTKNIDGLNERFQMHYLSILFFGMAIQRIMQGIMQTSVTTYLKITEGSTEASQAIYGLQAGFALLQFSVGEALGNTLISKLPILLSLIEAVSDFVAQNQALVSGLLIAGLAFGNFLMWTGIIKLGLAGLKAWIGKDGIIASLKALVVFIRASVIPAFASFGRSLLAFATNPIVLLITAIVALYIAWENNLFGMKDATYELFKTVMPIFVQIGQGLTNLISIILTAAEAVGNFLGWDTSGLNDAIVKMTTFYTRLEDVKNSLATIDKESYMDIKPLTNIITGGLGAVTGGTSVTNNVTIENIDMTGHGTPRVMSQYEMENLYKDQMEQTKSLLQRYGGGYKE